MDRSLQQKQGMTTGITLGRLAVLAFPALLFVGPQARSCETHPLARIAGEIQPGTPYSETLTRFESYAARSGPEQGGDAILGNIVPRGAGQAPARILFIQDLWMDRDVALTAWFGADQRVQGVEFICGGERPEAR